MGTRLTMSRRMAQVRRSPGFDLVCHRRGEASFLLFPSLRERPHSKDYTDFPAVLLLFRRSLPLFRTNRPKVLMLQECYYLFSLPVAHS